MSRILALGLTLSAVACDVHPDSLTYATACQVAGPVSPPPPLRLSPILGAAQIEKPLEMLPSPDDTERMFVVSQPGRIHMAERLSEDGDAPVWLDISERVEDGPNEAGLLGLAFDPEFMSNGRFYVNYTRTYDGRLQSVISRFTVLPPRTGRPDGSSEQVLLVLDQPYENHNGGSLAFGPDGFLYLGFGDGGSAGDPQNNAQRLDTLLGKILRIDVHGPAGYAVPADNPFVGRTDAQPEIWAYGLRNPWRFSFDPATGLLWVGDVGQAAQEEVDVITRGGNYGWRRMEGTGCYDPATDCQLPDLIAPLHAYGHGDGKSVTGGHVYRGAAMPALYGTYVFGDFVSGVVFGLTPGLDGVWRRATLVEEAGAVSAFGRDRAGELYVLDWQRGQLSRLVQADPTAMGAAGWPARLSQAGCFTDVPHRTLPAGALRYEVNVPLWSDGAAKERALILPAAGRIGYTPEGAWELPVGTLAIKTFLLAGRPVETRFLLREHTGFRGATYRWTEDGADAELLAGAATAELFGQTWSFPSRADCLACHTRVSGQVLGLTTPEWNRVHDVLGSGEAAPQIDTLARLGYFTSVPPPSDALPRYPALDDESTPVAARARAYLHVNCAHCHAPGGLASATIDLRATTRLADTGACDVPAHQGDLGVPGARIIAPGQPMKSTLYLRMKSTDPALRMPNLATRLVDVQATALIERFISGLTGCAD